MDSSNEKNLKSIQNLKEKIKSAWYEDGMFEIGIGVLTLFVSFSYFIFRAKLLPANRLTRSFLLCVMPLIGSIVYLWLMRKLKKKFVWDKTGYSVGRDNYSKSIWFFLCLSLLFLLFAVFSIRSLSSEITVLSFGFFLCFVYITQFFLAGRMKRFLIYSILPLVIACVYIFLGLPWDSSFYLMLFIIGCASIVSGIIVYRDFRRKLIS
jgi:uncharacterized Tic20 family protein